MALGLGTILEEGTMMTKHQDDLIISSAVVLGIGQENVLLVVVVVGFHHAPGMLVQVMEIIMETTMMTAIVVVDMVKETMVLIVGTDMAVVIDMAVIAMHLIIMHIMDMERNGGMITMVLLLGEVTAMSEVALDVMKEATEKDQGPMIAQVVGAQLMMIAIND